LPAAKKPQNNGVRDVSLIGVRKLTSNQATVKYFREPQNQRCCSAAPLFSFRLPTSSMPATQNTKSTKKSAGKIPKEPVATRRSYNSPLRRQQTVDTRGRIVAVGAEIARKLPSWDWSAMTFKTVGERADMSERTVRRHFTTERALRDAIQQQLLQECGVDFDQVELPHFADAAEQILRYLAGFASAPQAALSSDPGFTAMDADRRTSLLKAVARATPGWTSTDRKIAAATLDLFWTPVNFERLGSAWQLDQAAAIKLIRWAVSLIHGAIREGKRP
jgi:AcrR family transcriptional regulator